MVLWRFGESRGHEDGILFHTTVPSWRYRDLQQELLQGSPSGAVRFVRFPWAAVAAASVIVFLPGSPKVWRISRTMVCAFRQEISVRSNQRRRAVLGCRSR
jgi:hypothetical protein